jgi:hypothetical protein
MDMLNLAKQLNAKEIDGKVYVDMDHLISALFNACEIAGTIANDTRDPALAMMAAGMTSMVDSMEATLRALQERLR